MPVLTIDPRTFPDWLAPLQAALNTPVYIVGGAVRDLVRAALARGEQGLISFAAPGKDMDLACALPPRESMQRLSRAGYTVAPTGIDHGTITVARGPGQTSLSHTLELTTFRRDCVCDGRWARVEFTERLEEDLARRDFTFNAMAIDARTGGVIDLFGGAADLGSRRVRAVGDPGTRFEEDHLRLLRAVRFAALVEGEIEPATWGALVERAAAIGAVSAERIRDELLKLLRYPRPSHGFLLLHASGLLEHILPELAAGVGVAQNRYHRDDVFVHTLRVVDALPPDDPLLRWAALMHDIAKPDTRGTHPTTGDYTFYRHEVVGAKRTGKIMRRLRFSNAEIERVTHVVRHHMFAFGEPLLQRTVRRWIHRVGDGAIEDLLRLRQADVAAIVGGGETEDVANLEPLRREIAAIRAANDALCIADLAIDGHDLIALGVPKGPLIGVILNRLLGVVLDRPQANTREELMALVREWLAAGVPQQEPTAED